MSYKLEHRKEKQRLAQAKYRERNREKINAATRARYAADPAKYIRMVQESRERHYDRYITYSRKYESENREARVKKIESILKPIHTKD